MLEKESNKNTKQDKDVDEQMTAMSATGASHLAKMQSFNSVSSHKIAVMQAQKERNTREAGSYMMLGHTGWEKIVNGNQAKRFWSSISFLQSVIKHPHGVGEPIYHTFYAPLD
jgi:hypothetical protein